MKSEEIKTVATLIYGLSQDVKEWEERGCPKWCGDTKDRVGGTATGIKNTCKFIRRYLLQICRDIDNM